MMPCTYLFTRCLTTIREGYVCRQKARAKSNQRRTCAPHRIPKHISSATTQASAPEPQTKVFSHLDFPDQFQVRPAVWPPARVSCVEPTVHRWPWAGCSGWGGGGAGAVPAAPGALALAGTLVLSMVLVACAHKRSHN